jgi:hypothetical protein
VKDDGKTAPELRAALSSPLPTSALPMASRPVFKGGAGKGAVVLDAHRGTDLDTVEEERHFNNDLEVVVTAADTVAVVSRRPPADQR